MTLVDLADHDALARRVWEYYIETLVTDGLMTAAERDGEYNWEKIAERVRQNFVDSVRVNVSQHVVRHVDAAPPALVDNELYDDGFYKEAHVGRTYRCYICSREGGLPIGSGGVPVCPRCKETFSDG